VAGTGSLVCENVRWLELAH